MHNRLCKVDVARASIGTSFGVSTKRRGCFLSRVSWKAHWPVDMALRHVIDGLPLQVPVVVVRGRSSLLLKDWKKASLWSVGSLRMKLAIVVVVVAGMLSDVAFGICVSHIGMA